MGDVHPGVTATNHPEEPHPAPCIVRAHSRQEQKPQTSEIFMSHGIEIQTKWFISAFWQVASTQQKEGQQNYIYTWFRARCLSYFISPNKKLKKTQDQALIQLSFLEEPFQCAPSAVRAKQSSEVPPQVSTRPSVQELQGALSLGNGKIIKQVTSGTCFSEVTSGRDNSVSVSDDRGFPGLATGLCSIWLIGRCWDKVRLLISPNQKQPLPLTRAPHISPFPAAGLWSSTGAQVGRRHPSDPGDPPAPGLRQGCSEGHGASQPWGALCQSSVPEMRAMKKTQEWKGWEFFTGISLFRKHAAAAMSSELEFLSQVLPQPLSTSTPEELPEHWSWCAGFPGQCRSHTCGSDLAFWHYTGFRWSYIGSCSKYALQTTSFSAAWQFASNCYFPICRNTRCFFRICRTYFYFVSRKVHDSTAVSDFVQSGYHCKRCQYIYE